MKGNHNLEATGLDLQEIELLDSSSNCPAADLFDDSYAVVGVNHLVAYVEMTVTTDHAGTPTSRRKSEELNKNIIFHFRKKGNYGKWVRQVRASYKNQMESPITPFLLTIRIEKW
jgi:hypothetical protein